MTGRLLSLALLATLLASCVADRSVDRPAGGDQASGYRNAAPLSEFRQRVVAIAVGEWEFFGRQRGGNRRGPKEHMDGYRQRVQRYWREGTGRTVRDVRRVGWSGAFVAWVMSQAGAGESYPRAGPHAIGIRRAIRARRNGLANASFVGHRLDEYRPRPGDLVCNARQRGVDYDHVPRRHFSAHCDIVVAVRPGAVVVIGGNLTNAVARRTLLADRQGYIRSDQPRSLDPSVKAWFVVIETRL